LKAAISKINLRQGESKMPLERVVETDVLVIGGGIAGCFAAIKAREQGFDVTIVDKAYAGKSGASIAAQIFWMVFNPEWGADFDQLMETFIKSGEYINNREWCEIILRESLAVYQDLVSWGVEFHPEWRKCINMFPPFTGIRPKFRKTAPVLRKQAERVGVRIIDRIMCTDLLKQGEKVVGAAGFSYDTGALYIFKAKAIVLTAGGSSYRPPLFAMWSITGDGEGMAYRAGAEITGKEFPSTFPTIATYPLWGRVTWGYLNLFPRFATDGEGNKTFPFSDYLQSGAEGFRREWKLNWEFLIHAGRGPIFWDLAQASDEDIKEARRIAVNSGYQSIENERIGLELSHRGKIPAAGGPAGYSLVGASGVWVINTKCATSLPGLYAAGDCGGTRHNGAFNCNPGLGSCPAAVTGRRAGIGAAEYALKAEKPMIDEEELSKLKKTVYAPLERRSGFSPRWVTQLLQNTMTPYFIIYIKHGERLQAALTIVEFLRDHLVPKLMARDPHELRLAHETKNMVLSAEMTLRASLFRTESRGLHYREDYPRRDDPAWLAWTKIKEEQGRMKVLKEPVPKEWWPDLSQPYKERYDLRFPGEPVE
jgi:succinate dehydrogenase/fumarate reductase flavoprotein subunit